GVCTVPWKECQELVRRGPGQGLGHPKWCSRASCPRSPASSLRLSLLRGGAQGMGGQDSRAEPEDSEDLRLLQQLPRGTGRDKRQAHAKAPRYAGAQFRRADWIVVIMAQLPPHHHPVTRCFHAELRADPCW